MILIFFVFPQNPNIGQHLRTQYAPSNAPATVPVENQYIEHHKRDSRGGYITKRYLKGALCKSYLVQLQRHFSLDV